MAGTGTDKPSNLFIEDEEEEEEEENGLLDLLRHLEIGR